MSTEEKAKWFDNALRFYLDENVHLIMKSKSKDDVKWGITNSLSGQVLNSNMEWEDEPPAQKRDEAFLIRARFPFEQAVALYSQFKEFAL